MMVEGPMSWELELQAAGSCLGGCTEPRSRSVRTASAVPLCHLFSTPSTGLLVFNRREHLYIEK